MKKRAGKPRPRKAPPPTRRQRAARLAGTAAAALLGLWGLHAGLAWIGIGDEPPFADADDPVLVSTGAAVYRDQCALCHGAKGEGQPNWQMVGPDGQLPAPPHDESGHSWMHPDDELVQIIRQGSMIRTNSGRLTGMPAFGGRLSGREIAGALAFIKSLWPTGVRVYQAALNPGEAGMLRTDADTDWNLPENCTDSAALGAQPATPAEGGNGGQS